MAQYEALADGNRRVHPELARRLAVAPPRDRIKVILWLKEPEQAGAVRPDADEEASMPAASRADMVAARADSQRAAVVEQLTRPTLANLRRLDPRARPDRLSPAVYATLPATAIALVAQWSEVATVYEDVVNQPDLNVARPTILADAVHAVGITGAGVQVAQIEVGGRVAAANPYLNGVTQDAASVCAAASAHSTGVAGIIRSTHGTHRGIAPSVALRAGGSCNGISSELQSQSTAAADWGAKALNLSWVAGPAWCPGRTIGSMTTWSSTGFARSSSPRATRAGPAAPAPAT
jgi:hypothetical protein